MEELELTSIWLEMARGGVNLEWREVVPGGVLSVGYPTARAPATRGVDACVWVCGGESGAKAAEAGAPFYRQRREVAGASRLGRVRGLGPCGVASGTGQPWPAQGDR